MLPASLPVPPSPTVSFVEPEKRMRLPPEVLPVSLLPDAPPARLDQDFRGSLHQLDRSLPRNLDYKGFRFRNIDHLYLAFMVEAIGGPEKVCAVAKQME